MIRKLWTTNHGTPIEPVKPPQHPVFDGTLGENGPPVLMMREGESTDTFAERLVAGLYFGRN